MEQFGYVLSSNEDRAKVEVKRMSGCGGNCGSCGGGCDVPSVVIDIKNSLNAKVGDFVKIEGKPKKVFKYAILIYSIPFVMLVLGIIVGVNLFKSKGYSSYELYGFLMGLAFVIPSLFVLSRLDKKLGNVSEEIMEMVKILN